MLQLRRNHGTSSLLQDASRAGNRIAEDALGVAQTARTELGGLGREARDQAATGVTRARRRTARGLESAASTVDQSSRGKRRGRKSLVMVAVAGLAGWIAVKVLRSSGPQAEEVAAEADEKAAEAKKDVAKATKRTADKVADEAEKVGAQANARSGSNAAH